MPRFLAEHRDQIVPGSLNFLMSSFVRLYPLIARFTG